ncbi:hypothetical protein FA15DRAFT_662607 [Coprinopsis marcescibilis]|uniref:Amino acid transporter transmembrane domain-containing protein n=1 Tax=Coprinopsis marcescibilis TaxID=230819 RepID=A0A5C3LCM4_COPMA|nr:hypothetical protein FA15DRAFT_662607 [Coprinopsis marcescibilis]
MASFGTSFHIGSAVSATGSVFSDAFESYRRAQYLVAGSAVATASEASDHENDDEEAVAYSIRHNFDSDDEYEEGEWRSHERSRQQSFVGQFDWDEDQDEPIRHRPTIALPPTRSEPFSRRFETHPVDELDRRPPRESTPLLVHKASSIQEPLSIEEPATKDYGAKTPVASLLAPPSLHRRPSIISQGSHKVQYTFGGRSTYGQTMFNSIAILLGIGMLSEPLAFAYAGWGAGTFLIISYAFVACYTGKILARIIIADPRLRSYSDIGRKAFGPRATVFISGMFCLELFAVTVVLVTLYADSLHSLAPQYSENVYKLMGLVILIPTVFMPLSVLSYTSILGTISTVMLLVVIFIDGLSKKEAPGSLWDPAPTNLGYESLNKLGLAFGLFMAGFSGHAVIPSLARDMADPSRFDEMIDRAFIIATVIYTAIGAAGYMMFGDSVSDEISIDLLNTPGYSPLLNRMCLWLLVISPLSKFGLNTQPLNTTIEILLGIDTPNFGSPEELVSKPDALSISPHGSHIKLKKTLGVIQRVTLTVLSVVVSIAVPEFSSMMAFLGSFSAFMLSIVGPVIAKVTIERRCGVWDGIIIISGIVMAIWGTFSAFWAAS